jgi:hypothetical protein
MMGSEVLANEFAVRYDKNGGCLYIHTVHDRKEDPAIKIRLDTLKGMTPNDASKWVGETILLLIPSLRSEIFGLPVEGGESEH